MSIFYGDRHGHVRAYVLIGRHGAWGCVDASRRGGAVFGPTSEAYEPGRGGPARLEWQRMLSALDARLRVGAPLPIAATVLVDPTLIALHLPDEPQIPLDPRAWLAYAQRHFGAILGAPPDATRRLVQAPPSPVRLVGAMPTPVVEMHHLVRLAGAGQRRSTWTILPTIAFAWNIATGWRRPTPARPLLVATPDAIQAATPTARGLSIGPCIPTRGASARELAAELAAQALTPHTVVAPILVDLLRPVGRDSPAMAALLGLWPGALVYPWPAVTMEGAQRAAGAQNAPRRVSANGFVVRGHAR